MTPLTKREANYIYAALMRGDLAINPDTFKTPKTIYIYTNPDNALNPDALSYFKRSIKALYADKRELANQLLNWGLENA